MSTVKKHFKLTVEIDEKKLIKHYPNFSINYNNASQFIDSIALGLNEHKLSKYGYNIIIK